ncbi:uncharacterized protein METZ01_LOCUS141797 [marine metagenome]|uniref:Uncharacterized protein n=1 Tax=marine metagenome TaxID=408172 RepID=A0A381ZJL4_9ZZZZ
MPTMKKFLLLAVLGALVAVAVRKVRAI